VKIPRRLREPFDFVKQTVKVWGEGDVPALGASIAFYTLFSIGPLILIVIAIAGFVFGADAAQGKVFAELNGMLGSGGAKAVQDIVESSNRPKTGTLASIAGVVMFVFAATGAFAQIKAALNKVWQAKESDASGVKNFLKTRIFSFAIVLIIGFLMMVSLIGSSLINVVSERILADDRLAFLAEAANIGLSLVIFTALCAAIFKFLPDVKIPWRDVWLGAAITTVLFIAGRTGLAAYLGRESTTNVYGAASSLVLVLLWVYYCSQIFLLGAAITFVYAQRHGSRSALETGAPLAPDTARRGSRSPAPVSRSAPIATPPPASRLWSLRRRHRGPVRS
jgi:membrane protein